MGRFIERNRFNPQFGMVSVAFGIRREDSRTRASLAKELKVSIRSDVPALDPDRTGTGGFAESSPAGPRCGFSTNVYSLIEYL